MTLGTFLLLVLAVILLFFAIKKYMEWRILVNKINLLPSFDRHWFFELLLPYFLAPFEDYMEIIQHQLDEFSKTGASLVGVWFFHIPYVGIIRASAAEALLKSPTEITKTGEYKLLRPWLGLGLLTSTGQKWHSHRKLLTPSFHFQILENFVSVFNEQSQILVDQLGGRVGKESFDISPYISKCTLDVICDTAMGRKLHAQTKSDSDYVQAVVTLSEIIAKKFILVWRTVPFIYSFFPDKRREEKCLKTIHRFINEVIRERQEERARLKSETTSDIKVNNNVYGSKKRTAFLDTLLDAIENGQGYLSNEEIREEVDTFMFEGHDTTASGLVTAIMNLALHPDVQKKAQEEIESIFGDSDRPVEMADLSKMKYLEAIIKETLRLHPPVPLFTRVLKEDLIVDGYTVPKETRLVVIVRSVHRDSSIYKNPHDFNPSRFLKENDNDTRHPYGFIAFSAGPRNCIGQKFALMEEKVVLTYLLRNYTISGNWTEKQAKMSIALVSRPLEGLQVTLARRR